MGQSQNLKTPETTRPDKVDLRQWCSPIENQKELGSCTANAGVGLFEWYQRRAFGKHLDLSRLFLYKMSRKLMGWQGDQGSTLRATMQAMKMFGAPLESFYPYDEQKFDQEPAAFHYAMAHNFEATKYYRLDPPGTPKQKVLVNALNSLSSGLPFMFGFTVYSSIGDGPLIPFPKDGDTAEGGHAVMAVGYDVSQMGGVLIIRNSWGKEWGGSEKGYGFLPFSFVTSGLVDDLWALVQADFVDTDVFK